MSRQSKGKLPPGDSPLAQTGHSAGLRGEASPPELQPDHHWLSFAVCLFLAAAVWVVFGQTIHCKFINFDDDQAVYKNPIIIQGLNLPGIVQLFTHIDVIARDWHPLTSISHMVDWQVYGSNAGGHHLTNVLLHAATAILLFLVLRNLTGALWRSAFVAAVFALHPLRVESVAWVTERKDVLSGLFFMLTLWCYFLHARKQGTGSGDQGVVTGGPFFFLQNPYFWALFFFGCSLMSKVMVVTLPFILLLLDYWPLKRLPVAGPPSTTARLAWEKAPFLLLSAGGCAMTILAQENQIVGVHGLTFSWRAGNALMAYADYLWKMFYPFDLTLIYPYVGMHLPVWRVGLSVLVLLTISAGVVAGRRKHPYLLAGWLWYLGMLVPVIDIKQAGIDARADRYTYLPQIGLYILLAWGVVELCGGWRHRRAVLGSVAVVIIAGLMVAAHGQTEYWKDSVHLWSHSLACTSGNSEAHFNLANALAAQGELDEAISQFEQALQIQPGHVKAQNNLGNALAAQGKYDEAIPHYERAVQLDPAFAAAHYDLGNALAGQGKLDEAIQQFKQVLQLEPDSADLCNNLGNALIRQGKLVEAVQQYERALQLNPAFADAHNNLGSALAGQGKLSEAIQQCEQALQLNPDLAKAHYNLGVLLFRQGKPAEAQTHLQRALILAAAQNNPTFAEAIRTRLKSLPSASTQP